MLLRISAFVLYFIYAVNAFTRVVYMSSDGNDAGEGTKDRPFATLPVAYAAIQGGDTICVRGGTYAVTDEQIMKKDRIYAYVFALEKAGTEDARTCIMGYPGERPVFDFSALQMDGRHRFAAFYLGADYLHLKNFDIVGVPVRVLGHTQSECVSARKGSHCIVENISMHDNMAIGYYQNAGSYNLVLNCDAYNNYDDFSEGAYGGNVDGFGCHIRTDSDKGNVFRNCRAWRNSDDGFDLINCNSSVEIDHCWAFYNGFRPTEDAADTLTFISAGDGNGLKAGGWGMNPVRTKCPQVCPSHYIHHCIAYKNKANGLYSNHHLAGNRWENNTSAFNMRDNYNMVNRLTTYADGNTDVPGYGHEIKNNVSYRPGKQHLSNVSEDLSTQTNNSFSGNCLSVEEEDFVSVSQKLMFVQRDAEGNLPYSDFFRTRPGSALELRGLGWLQHRIKTKTNL